MTPEEVKAAVTAETPALREAFLAYAEKIGLEITSPRYAESWRAWEWCRRQLLARGVSTEEAQRLMFRVGQKDCKPTPGSSRSCARGMHTCEAEHGDPYEAISECVNAT